MYCNLRRQIGRWVVFTSCSIHARRSQATARSARSNSLLLTARRDWPTGRQAKSTSPYGLEPQGQRSVGAEDHAAVSKGPRRMCLRQSCARAASHRAWATCAFRLAHVPAGTRCNVRRGPTSMRNSFGDVPVARLKRKSHHRSKPAWAHGHTAQRVRRRPHHALDVAVLVSDEVVMHPRPSDYLFHDFNILGISIQELARNASCSSTLAHLLAAKERAKLLRRGI